MKTFTFGNSPEMADELLDLVINGKKTATSWAAVWGPEEGGQVGHNSIIMDSKGNKRVVVETIEVTRKPFLLVDESFARAEGEGDLSLEYWHKEHERFFMTEGTFKKDMEVYCERFKVIKISPQSSVEKPL